MADARRAQLKDQTDISGARALIVEARFYDDIQDALLEGAVAELKAAGVSHEVITVPGALEIPAAIAIALDAAETNRKPYDAAIALGCALLALGESRLAAQRFCDGLALVHVVPLMASLCLDGLAAVAVADGDPSRAARLAGAAGAMRADGGFLAPRSARELAERIELTARAALGDRGWEEELASGAAMTLDEAVAFALEALPDAN